MNPSLSPLLKHYPQVIAFPKHDFEILPQKGNFATEPPRTLPFKTPPRIGDFQLTIEVYAATKPDKLSEN
jgi:hypothetical protein